MAEAQSLRIKFRSNPLQTYLHLSWECVLCTVFNFIKTGQYEIVNQQWSRTIPPLYMLTPLEGSSKEFNFWHWNSSLVSSFWKSRFQSSLKQVFNERHFHLGVDQIHISIGILCCQVGEPCYRLWQELLTLSNNSCFHQERKYFQKINQNVHCWHLQIGESADASNLQL